MDLQEAMVEVKTVRPGVGRPLSLEELSLGDLEAIRLMLHGGSVVDWHQLNLRDHADVDRFLRINEFNPESEDEMSRLEELRGDAVEYLTRVFQFPIPDEVAYVVPARDLFLMASRKGKHQRWACVVLKVMHISNHLAGREVMTRLPIADDMVFRATELKVIEIVEELRAAGHPITEFEWSRKPRDSLITKLLAKRSTIAASVYDKLRFRLTVRNFEDIMPMLAMLTRQLIPFNYVVPGASINHLLPFETALQASQPLASMVTQLQSEDPEAEEQVHSGAAININEFSGPNYRIINFVVDLPLRLEALVSRDKLPSDDSHVVFVLTEFQLADKRTSVQNEKGESSHDRYKARQHRKVLARLMRGGLPHDDS